MDLYNNYSKHLREKIGNGDRIQKLSVNGGFTCPNRDGKIGIGGCTFCNNQTFVPEYCKEQKSIKEQVVEGIEFFKHKYKTQKYLVYFQSYTNTYGNLEKLKNLYEDALDMEEVCGLVIGTRPDCVDSKILNYLENLNKSTFVCVEYGIESTHDVTLKKINRGHSHECSINAINETASRGIETGGHLIMGLPGESHEMMMESAYKLNELPLNSLKLHQLQIIKGTKLGIEFENDRNKFHIFKLEEYIDTSIDFIERLKYEIGIERFVSSSPKELLIAPQWGIKNYEFVSKFEKRMKERNAYQGKILNSQFNSEHNTH